MSKESSASSLSLSCAVGLASPAVQTFGEACSAGAAAASSRAAAAVAAAAAAAGSKGLGWRVQRRHESKVRSARSSESVVRRRPEEEEEQRRRGSGPCESSSSPTFSRLVGSESPLVASSARFARRFLAASWFSPAISKIT